jgi:hypothetical protein
MKKRPFGKGGRRSGGKVLGRKPLTVWIQGHQPYENIQFLANEGSPYLKDPHSKTLESDCLSPQTFHYDTVSKGRGKINLTQVADEWIFKNIFFSLRLPVVDLQNLSF